MGQGGTDIVDQLFFNQLFAVPDAVEHFADGDRRDGVLADQAETFLILRRRWVFHPEQAVLLNAFTEARRLDGRQAMVHVVQQVLIKTKAVAHRFEQFGG
ncbi:Uncharacterised protein [Serratia quinivorans]|uniref:Uncharacterized protein n=1 Tax=Serratia quinivorans TaxID=137545 RepID=A0A380A8G5_9GAMM|nr:Uncharacterised protein [Serratia quinivorans]